MLLLLLNISGDYFIKVREKLGAEGLVLAGNRFYRRVIPESTIDAITEEGGLINMPLKLIHQGREIPIFDILVPMAISNEPSNN